MSVKPEHGRHGAIYLLKPDAVPGNLAAEACTASGAMAQITDVTKRIIDPNNFPVFTDAGGAKCLMINFTNGTAYFDGNVTTVTVTGVNSYYPATQLTKVGYLTDWSFNASLDLGDASYMGQKWKNHLPGQAGGSGSAGAFFIGDAGLIEGITNKKMFFLQLFTFDPDQDQTGDHFNTWVWFNGNSVNGSVGDAVKETIDFTLEGMPSFAANV